MLLLSCTLSFTLFHLDVGRMYFIIHSFLPFMFVACTHYFVHSILLYLDVGLIHVVIHSSLQWSLPPVLCNSLYFTVIFVASSFSFTPFYGDVMLLVLCNSPFYGDVMLLVLCNSRHFTVIYVESSFSFTAIYSDICHVYFVIHAILRWCVATWWDVLLPVNCTVQ